jgi:glycosyltransferase involved in cell wall biosynthesis
VTDGQVFNEPLLIVTLLREYGETGVQAHIGAFRSYLESLGRRVRVVTTFDAPSILLYPALVIRRLIEPVSGTLAVLWYRSGHSRLFRTVISRQLADGRPRVIYAQCPLSAWAALQSRKGDHQRIVLVVHFNRSQAIEWAEKGMIRSDGPTYAAIRELEREVLLKLDGIVYVSRYMKECLEQDIPGLDAVPCAVIPNFCNPTDKNLYQPAGDLVSVGTLEPRKNQSYLLHVLACARDLGHRYTLALVGSGPDREMLERLAGSLGIKEQISFLGYQEDASKQLPHYRMYVHGAVRENLPLAVIEALSCRLPIAAVPVGGIPEIFADEVEGVHWPLDDPDEGAKRLISVLEDRDTYARMSQAAGERFASHFDTAAVACRLASFLDQCGSGNKVKQ